MRTVPKRRLYGVREVPSIEYVRSRTFCYRYGLSKTAIMIIIISKEKETRKETGKKWALKESVEEKRQGDSYDV